MHDKTSATVRLLGLENPHSSITAASMQAGHVYIVFLSEFKKAGQPNCFDRLVGVYATEHEAVYTCFLSDRAAIRTMVNNAMRKSSVYVGRRFLGMASDGIGNVS